MTQQASLGKDVLKEIEDSLLAEKVRIESELSKFASKNSHVEGDFETDFPEYGDEEDDNAREVADYSTNKSLELTLEKTLRDIAKSLARIQDGTYGICKYCDKPISEKRLVARPTSGSCVECKKTLTDEV